MKLTQIKISKNESIMISLTLVTFIFLFGILWKSSSMNANLESIRAKAIISKQKLADNEALIAKLNQRTPASLAGNSEILDRYVLANDHFSSVITGIVSNAKGDAFKLSKLTLEEQATDNGYKKMLYALDAEASFVEIGKFLENLEDAPLLTEVQSIVINRIDNEMKRCQAHIKLYSYVRQE